MDSNSYKDLKTSRGINYHYYVSAAQDGKPTLLLCHGFPSTSYDWHFQVEFFKGKGYGLIVPDLLGYGGTDKPTDPEEYKMSLMTRDVIDILDEEKVDQVIAIGHDWGSILTSRLANYYPDRFVAFGFLVAPYNPPEPNFDLDEVLAMTEKLFGYPLLGYWKFFDEDSAYEVIEAHADSFHRLLFAADPTLWKTHVGPVGAAKQWCIDDQKTEYASYVGEEILKTHLDNLLKGGLAGPLCWYKAMVRGITPKDNADIHKEKYSLTKPVFYGATLKDAICLALVGKAAIQQNCALAEVTIVDFDTDHWVMFSAPQELNEALLKWVEGIKV